MQAIGSAIQVAEQQGLDIEDAEELMFRLNSSFKDILSYKKHLLRAFAQNHYWEQLMTQRDETKAYLCQDWAMKERIHNSYRYEHTIKNYNSYHICDLLQCTSYNPQ